MNENAPLWSRNFILVSSINFQLVLTFYLLVVVIVGHAVAELQPRRKQVWSQVCLLSVR